MRFTFLITARCNAACTHCAVNSGPYQTQALPKSKLLELMDEAAAIWRKERSPGEPLHLCVSGGEPFLDFPQLVELVAHGAGLGAEMSCVTNGYWASSDDSARAKLISLKAAGLSLVAVSTSRFHQAFVKPARVERALKLAGQVGLRTALKCALTAADKAEPAGLEGWAAAQGADQLEVFPVMPHLRDGAVLRDDEYIRDVALPEGTCPAPMITVREDGAAYTCCMPGGFVDFLRLGNVFDTGLQGIFDRFYLNGTQQALRHRGPAHFARAIIADGQGHRLRSKYEGVCDLCTHIASDPEMSAIARREARNFATARFRKAAWKLAAQKAAEVLGIKTVADRRTTT
jgi:MoaA/NifB/PqqE/SkfB family radical SAM enzyme